MRTIFSRQVNLYFFLPFTLWCLVGGYLLFVYDSTRLFAFVNGHYHPVTDTLMEWASRMGEGLSLVIIGLLVFLLKPFRNSWFVATAILCSVIPSLLTQLIKYQVAAPRPMTVYEHQEWVHHLSHWDLLHNNSFPSGHTTGAFGFFCMLACLVPARYSALGLLFFALPLATAYARMYLAAHFFADVYAGSIIGTLCSFFLCQLITYIKRRTEQRVA